jgi:peroxiredoxin
MPAFQQMADEIDGLSVVGVSIDTKDAKDVAKFLAKKKIRYRTALDSGTDPAWEAFHVAVIPAVFLVDGQGDIVAQWVGAAAEPAQVRQEVERRLAERSAAFESGSR